MQLTSTKSLHPYTMLSLMKREWVAWETQKLCLEFLKARNGSPLLQNGHQCGEELQEPFFLPFLTKKKNLLTMETTSKVNLQPSSLLPITKSFSMMLPSKMKSLVANILYSLTFKNSPNSTLPLYSLMASNLLQNKQTSRNLFLTKATTNLKSITSSTLEHARTYKLTTSTNISAKTVTSPVIPKRIALSCCMKSMVSNLNIFPSQPVEGHTVAFSNHCRVVRDSPSTSLSSSQRDFKYHCFENY